MYTLTVHLFLYKIIRFMERNVKKSNEGNKGNKVIKV